MVAVIRPRVEFRTIAGTSEATWCVGLSLRGGLVAVLRSAWTYPKALSSVSTSLAAHRL